MENQGARAILLGLWLCFGFIVTAVISTSQLSEHYSTPKTIVIYLTALGVAWAASNQKIVSLPRLKRQTVWLLGAIVIAAMLVMLTHGSSVMKIHQLADWLVFITLALAFWSVLGKERFIYSLALTNIASLLCVTLYMMAQAFGWEPFPSVVHSLVPSATFGFQNHAAEFLGISIVIAIASLDFRARYYRWLAIPTGLGIAALAITHCRAMEIASLTGVIAVAILRRQHCAKNLAIFLVLASLVAGTIWGTLDLMKPPGLPDWSSEVNSGSKQSNIALRIARWKNTAVMIADNPLGVGVGRYEFGYIIYSKAVAVDQEVNEATVVRSPHNGYLELMAEYGWLPSLFIFLLLGRMGLTALSCLWRPSATNMPATALFVGLGATLAIDAFFAFPIELPFPFFIASLCFGAWLLVEAESNKEVNSKGAAPAFLLIFLVISLTLSALVASNIIEQRSTDAKRLRIACEIYPVNWRLCIRSAHLDLLQDNVGEAHATLTKILLNWPDNFVALRLAAVTALKINNLDEARIYKRRYQQLFPETGQE